MARPKYQGRIDDVVERAVDVGLDAMFDRVTDFFQKQVETQRVATAAIPAEARRTAYKCAGCHQMFPFEALHMVSATGTNWAACDPCFRTMWKAADDNMAVIRAGLGDALKNLVTQARKQQKPPSAARSEPKGAPPWEVLGIDPDATIEEVKKAYRRKAAVWHPDRVPPGSSAEDMATARDRFEEVDRAYKSMMKVRSPAT